MSAQLTQVLRASFHSFLKYGKRDLCSPGVRCYLPSPQGVKQPWDPFFPTCLPLLSLMGDHDL